MSTICVQEFSKLLNKINPKSKVGIAVSGGADSMLLCYLLSKVIPKDNLFAMTVDHRLRPESLKEAEFVKEEMLKMGIKHEILTAWKDREPPKTNIEESSRKERYQLLFSSLNAHFNASADIALGHHLNDAVETFLFRFAKASGIDGLAGILPNSPFPFQSDVSIQRNTNIIRPLISFGKVVFF